MFIFLSGYSVYNEYRFSEGFHENRDDGTARLMAYVFTTVKSINIKLQHFTMESKVRILLGEYELLNTDYPISIQLTKPLIVSFLAKMIHKDQHSTPQFLSFPGIVFSDGLLWKKQRKFSLQHLRSFGFGRREMEEKILEETTSFIELLRTRCSQPIFMHNIFDVSVLNGLWAMMAGQRFEIDDERLKKLLKIIHDAFRIVDMSGGLLNQMPFLRFISPGASGYTKLREVLDGMWEFLGVSSSFCQLKINGSLSRVQFGKLFIASLLFYYRKPYQSIASQFVLQSNNQEI